MRSGSAFEQPVGRRRRPQSRKLEDDPPSPLLTRHDERTRARSQAMLMSVEVGAARLQAGSGDEDAHHRR
jgi:hypothetical protein